MQPPDVSAQSNRAAALQAEASRLHAIFDSSPVAMVVLNAELQIVRYNAAATILAYGSFAANRLQRLGDVLLCSHTRGGHPCQQSHECLLCPLRTGLAEVFAGDGRLRGVELELQVLRDGVPHRTWLRIGSEPLEIDGSRHLVVALDDITSHKDTVAALRLKNLVFDASIAANSISGIDGKLTEVNAAFLRIWGANHKNDVIGRPLAGLFANPQDSLKIICSLHETGEWEGDIEAKRCDGSTFMAHGLATAMRDEHGRLVGFQSAVVDVTERFDAARKLLELNEQLEHRVAARTAELACACEALTHRTEQFRSLAAELSQTEDRERRRIAQLLHDHPQQLLVAAKFNTATIRSQLSDPAMRAHALEVMNILDQANKALRSLTMELSPPILHDAGFAPGLHWLARWMMENYGLAVRVSAEPPLRPMSEDLRVLLFQAVRELLFNTVKHSGVKEARVTMESDDFLRIIVADSGKGFDTHQVLAGMPLSLGLFHLRERLSAWGGHMEIHSEPDGGTIVIIEVPFADPQSSHTDTPSPAAAASNDSNPLPHADESKIRLLVVDDHAVVRQGLVQMLTREPGLLIVGDACDGQDAVEKAALWRPDVILMDISMPRLNGLEATRRITREMPDVRIIGLSMHAQGEMTTQMHDAGACGYLVKDSPIDEIVSAIRNVMRQRPAV